ncbi:MAG TPA: hypothetical protein VGZ03_00580 [Acidimicrobiales bacterium]|nr:hypothetical protein [Acidimicrobiales bacterium]
MSRGGPTTLAGRAITTVLVVGALALGGVGVAVASPSVGRASAPAVAVRWGAAHPVEPAGGHPSAISCPTPAFCAVADTAGGIVLDAAGTWTAPSGVDAVGITSVSCASATLCVAVDGTGDALVYDGSTWTTQHLDTVALTSVSCVVAATQCVAVDVAGDAFGYVTGVWSAATPVASAPLSAVSCATTTSCEAVDAAGNAYAYTGTWSIATSLGSASLLSVDCPTATFCVAGDDAGGVDVLSTGVWTPDHAVLGHTDGVVAVACASGTSCVALGQDGAAAVYAGSWAAATQVFPADNGVGASCVAAASCTAVSAAGSAATFNGTAWSGPTGVDARPGRLTGVGCGAPRFCLAVDDTGQASRWNGSTWSARQPTGLGSLSAVSCAGTFCMAVSDNGGAVPFVHGTWRHARSIDPSALTGVSCVSSRFCAAVDAANHVLTFNGARWSAPRTMRVAQAQARGYNAVSCVTPTFCVAVDENGNELFFGAGRPFLHQAVACAATACRYNGESFSIPLTGVACATSRLCIAVDEEGNEVTYTARGAVRSWSRPGHIDAYRLTGIACTRIGYCLAVDDNGGTVIYDRGQWRAASRLVPLGAISAVACTSRATCAVTDASSAALGTATR